jgi:hypothetical protein
MSSKKSKQKPVSVTANEANPKPEFASQEKASVGGKYNSGVTSASPDEKLQIEKKASLADMQPLSATEKEENDATNNDKEKKESD